MGKSEKEIKKEKKWNLKSDKKCTNNQTNAAKNKIEKVGGVREGKRNKIKEKRVKIKKNRKILI